MQINVLGTVYTIYERSANDDPNLEDMDGYCDKTSHEIVITKPDRNVTISDFEVYRKKIMRHEILHAFLFESGLHENWTHDQGHDETYVDWIAAQFPKLVQAMQDAGCL